MPKAAPSVVSPLQPNDSGSQISKSIDLPPVARGLKLLSRVGLRFAQNALKTDHDHDHSPPLSHNLGSIRVLKIMGLNQPMRA